MSYPTNDLTWRKLQREVTAWANRNFPNALPYQPLLGAGEELGELMHAHLKAELGIRGTAEEHHAAKVDAIADITIYLADYCQRNGIDYQDAVERTWQKVSQRDWQANKQNGGEVK